MLVISSSLKVSYNGEDLQREFKVGEKFDLFSTDRLLDDG
jgi:hypothetical protein